jgi:CRISPR/Cas system Type II protein with McrA/HNH and RuvC-like nuclease domain
MAQKGRCSYCGRIHRTDYLEVDHKYPLSRGGGNEVGNLQLLCTPCNMRKGIQSDEEFRRRYRRLLPADGSIPHHPILQDDFTNETKRTKAPREVRAIYHERFSAYRRSQDGGFGFLVAIAVLVIIALIVLALML